VEKFRVPGRSGHWIMHSGVLYFLLLNMEFSSCCSSGT